MMRLLLFITFVAYSSSVFSVGEPDPELVRNCSDKRIPPHIRCLMPYLAERSMRQNNNFIPNLGQIASSSNDTPTPRENGAEEDISGLVCAHYFGLLASLDSSDNAESILEKARMLSLQMTAAVGSAFFALVLSRVHSANEIPENS